MTTTAIVEDGADDVTPTPTSEKPVPVPVLRNRWVRALHVTPAQRDVLWALLDHVLVNEHRTVCWPSQGTLAAEAGMCERSVRTHLTALETAGVIARKRRQGRRKGSPGGRDTDLITLVGLPAKDTLTVAGGSEGLTGKNGGVEGGLTGKPHAQTRRGTPHKGNAPSSSPRATARATVRAVLAVDEEAEILNYVTPFLTAEAAKRRRLGLEDIGDDAAWLAGFDREQLLRKLEAVRDAEAETAAAAERKATREAEAAARLGPNVCPECNVFNWGHTPGCSRLPDTSCPECGAPAGMHARGCVTKEPLRCDCGAEVTRSEAVPGRPCRVCRAPLDWDRARAARQERHAGAASAGEPRGERPDAPDVVAPPVSAAVVDPEADPEADPEEESVVLSVECRQAAVRGSTLCRDHADDAAAAALTIGAGA